MTWLLVLVVLLLARLPGAGAGVPPQPALGSDGSIQFSGRVVDPRGRPAPGATVFVSLNEPASPGAGPPPRPRVSQTQAAADGSFRLDVPAPRKEWAATVVAVQGGHGPGGEQVRSPAEATGLVIRLTHPSFLAGKVVDRAGQPIAGAKVSAAYTYRFNGEMLYLPPEEARPPVVTDAQGRFRLAPLAANSRVVLTVEHPSYPPLSAMRMPFASGRDDLMISLAPPSVVVGRVVDGDGRPAAGVTVRCEGWGPPVPSETTDGEGRFRFTRLREDHYHFRAELPGEIPDSVSDTQGVVPPEGGEARCPDLRLVRGGVVTGKVTDEKGQPIAGIPIDSMRQFHFLQTNTITTARGPGTHTGADGVYRLRLPPGKWRVAPGYFGTEYTSGIPWDEWPQREVAEGQTVSADLTLQRALTVRGRIVDAGGRPAAGTRVQRGSWTMLRADAAGRFTLGAQLPPRQATELVFLSRDGSEGAALEVTPAKVRGALVVRLQRLPAATGLVTNLARKPVGGAWITADRMVPTGGGMSETRPESVAATTADMGGRFTLPLFPGTRYRITVQAEGYGAADQFPVIPGGPGARAAPLRFRLERADGVIAGVVVDPDGNPVPGAEVNAGRTGATNVYTLSEDCVSDAQGRFRLTHLTPGMVSVTALRPGYEPDSHRSVRVGTANIRLMLPPREEALPAPTALKAGACAPEIQATRWINGTGVPGLSALRGKTVLLQFSSAYNRAAVASNAALKALSARLKAAGRGDVVILALYDSAAPAGEVEAYARSEGLLFPIGLVEETRNQGLDSAAFKAYGVRHLPTVFLIDREGMIRAVDPTREELMALAAAREGP